MANTILTLTDNLKVRLYDETNGLKDSLMRLGLQSQTDVNLFTSPIIRINSKPNEFTEVFALSSNNLLIGYKFNPIANTYSLFTSMFGNDKAQHLNLYSNMLMSDINDRTTIWKLGYYYKTEEDTTYCVIYTKYAVYSFFYDNLPDIPGGNIVLINILPIVTSDFINQLIETSTSVIGQYIDANN